MNKLDKTKSEAINTLKKLCSRCKTGLQHSCPIANLVQEVADLRGIPIIVNDNLYHVVFN